MPYVQQKTWIQLAPKIRNLSLRESPYGMGLTIAAHQMTPQEVGWWNAEQAQRPAPTYGPTPQQFAWDMQSWMQKRSAPPTIVSQPANWAAVMAAQKGMGLAPFPASPCYDDAGNLIDCGGATPGLTIVNPTSDVYTGMQLPASQPTSPPATTTPFSLTSWLQANQQAVLLVGAGLFGLALFSGMGRR